MFWNLLLFALIGFLVGTAARWLVPGRQPLGILVTMALGIVGSLLGGLLSWVFWPAVDGQFRLAGVLMSFLGTLTVLWPYSLLAGRIRG